MTDYIRTVKQFHQSFVKAELFCQFPQTVLDVRVEVKLQFFMDYCVQILSCLQYLQSLLETVRTF